MNDATLQAFLDNPDYKILKRVSNKLDVVQNLDSKTFIASIIDLETMGLDAKSHEIIEIGILAFSFSSGDGIINIVDSYNELQDPGKPIPAEITKVTGITDQDVHGKSIDWDRVLQLLTRSNLIICHNSRFDRNFLELQTPVAIQQIIKNRPFGCTISDIDWRSRGYESSKLEFLNFKLGYFYEGHRALVDCWATLNLLLQEKGAFDELKANVRSKETLLCAKNADYDKKDLLKSRNYRWSDGTNSLPKCWWIIVKNDQMTLEREWLDEHIYSRQGASASLPFIEITAFKRYSFRAEDI
jgi:DNA polymerase-3 subunit epsilon